MRASPHGLALLIPPLYEMERGLGVRIFLRRGIRENAAPQDIKRSQRIEVTAVQSKGYPLRREITGAVR